jgi:hypothetical protein
LEVEMVANSCDKKKPNYQRAHGAVGVGVDYQGAPVIDPTANVIALSEAASQRQDDLREANNIRIDAELKRVDADIKHLKEMAELRAQHYKELAELESSRLNAIRQVDVSANENSSKSIVAEIRTLAATTASNAENVRTSVANTATVMAKQLSDTVAGMNQRLENLEKRSYTGEGKHLLADPQISDLIIEMRSLSKSRDTGEGKSGGIHSSWLVIVGASSLILALLSIGMMVAHFARGG